VIEVDERGNTLVIARERFWVDVVAVGFHVPTNVEVHWVYNIITNVGIILHTFFFFTRIYIYTLLYENIALEFKFKMTRQPSKESKFLIFKNENGQK